LHFPEKDDILEASNGPDREVKTMRPQDFAIYKGISGKYGAAQFKLIQTKFKCPKCREENFISPNHTRNKHCDGEMRVITGAILVEVTSAVARNRYDWENSIKLALNITDISKILNAFSRGEKIGIYHDPNKGKPGAQVIDKKLTFSVGRDGSYFLKIFKKIGDDKIEHSLPISKEEIRVLKIIFEAAIPKILCWS